MPSRWVVLPEGALPDAQASYSQILAVHAALLHTGKVLMFGGSEHVYDSTMRSIDDPRIDNTRLWDPVTGAVSVAPSPQPPPAHLYDLFCCGHALLVDGRLLVGGGTSAYPPDVGDHHHEHYRGSRRSSVFDPVTGSWSATGEMIQPPPQDVVPGAGPNPDGTLGGGGRWYPTLLLLPDRTVVAFGGHPQAADLRHSNYSVEVWEPGSGSWRWAGEEPEGKHIEIYDHLAEVHLALGEKAEAVAAWKKGLDVVGKTPRELHRKADVEKKLKANQ